MSSNGRNEEQVKADEELTQAIDNCLKAYGIQDDYILTDYLIICAQVRMDEDGDQITAYSHLYRDSDLPYHRIMGLLEVARVRAAIKLNDVEEG